ncbi:hypothetical protein [Microbulbifer spongiae]|uniref:DUF983 domain-containing protein n=1 Tax=Microbulbifer spongiae TaxID=2944933 RepID=A0ABY9EFR7_9GAMM|nr:hypothetical protein [Microbulbifer sp. MI-G]WKD49611.1 hypothetical protein M8T91_17240 [Microbulbifer sp. MI-G]
MENLICPSCKGVAVTKVKKLKVAFLGGALRCRLCGEQIKVGGSLLATIAGAGAGSAALYVALYSLKIGSWFPIVSVFVVGWTFAGLAIYLSGLKHVGTKRFRF